jgi:pimeloyl-ACP methyl ester carboxylesterase
MLYIIDGTGPDASSDYIADMRRGFCWSLDQRNGPASVYLRGPTELGLQTWEIADLMHAQVRADLKRQPDMEIVLAGHSRGGSAVIYLARKLQKEGVPVRAMVLFDAVRRALQKSPAEYARQVIDIPPIMIAKAGAALIEVGLDFFQRGQQEIDVIPGNVKRALHLVRDERFSNYFLRTAEFRSLAGVVQGPGAKSATPLQRRRYEQLHEMHRRLRDACRFDCIKFGLSTGFSFGNTGLEAEPPCQLTIERFEATHGAMGGAPLEVSGYIADQSYAADIQAQEVVTMLQVQARVNAFLAEVNSAVASGQRLAGAQLAYVPMTPARPGP